MIDLEKDEGTKVSGEAKEAINSPPKPKEVQFFYGRKCLNKTCKVTDKHGGQQVVDIYKFRKIPMVSLFCTGCTPLDKKKHPLYYSISLSAL